MVVLGGTRATRAWIAAALSGALLIVGVTAQAAPSTQQGRLAGTNRFETSARISQHVFASAPVAYVARADAFPDALAGGALSDGPILLVPATGTPPAVITTEIGRLNPSKVVALGGTAAVSDEMLAAVAAGRGTGRLAGPDRFSTAVAISKHVFPSAATVYLARADAFADALAGGVLTDGPILLVPREGSPPQVVLDEVDRLGATKVVALGGQSAVGPEVLGGVARGRQTGRLAGDDRFSTAAAIARAAFGCPAPAAYLARADDFPDALGGGALVDGPILTVPTTGTLPAAIAKALADLAPSKVLALGGTAAVSDSMLQQAAAAAGGSCGGSDGSTDGTQPSPTPTPTPTGPLAVGQTRWVSPTNNGRTDVVLAGADAVSADGRYVLISEAERDEYDLNDLLDIRYLRHDVHTGARVHIDVNDAGQRGDPFGVAVGGISDDGRRVAFSTPSTHLVAGDHNDTDDVFVRDIVAGTTRLVSRAMTGGVANGTSMVDGISGDGRVVVFTSTASDLIPGTEVGYHRVYAHTLSTGATELVSIDPAGQPFEGGAGPAVVSSDGRYVAFMADAEPVTGPHGEVNVQLYLRDRVAGTTVLVSRSNGGARANGFIQTFAIAGNGRVVAFDSNADNLVPGDTVDEDIFIRDLTTNTTVKVTHRHHPEPDGYWTYTYGPSLSADGTRLTFMTDAVLTPGDGEATGDVYLLDRSTGSLSPILALGPQDPERKWVQGAALSADGSTVAITGIDETGDGGAPPDNYWHDVYVHRLR